jgi:uncharacterized protein DUF1931
MIAQLPADRMPPRRPTGISRFERLFRVAAGLDIDKSDIKRHEDFVNRKIYDLLVCAEETARLNGRDVIEVRDLPIARGCGAVSKISKRSMRPSNCGRSSITSQNGRRSASAIAMQPRRNSLTSRAASALP